MDESEVEEFPGERLRQVWKMSEPELQQVHIGARWLRLACASVVPLGHSRFFIKASSC